MHVTVRQATEADAEAMSHILRDILLSWNSDRPSSAAHVLAYYIQNPQSLKCSVAVTSDGSIAGFQSLQIAKAGKPYEVPDGWGVIGTYVDSNTVGKGVGRALFASSLQAARGSELKAIDAKIGENNAAGLAYYEAVGFRTYQTKDGAVCKKFTLT